MRARVVRIVGAILLAAALVTVADPQPATAANSLNLSPTHGPPGTMVTATFFLDEVECFPDTVSFTWGGVAWASGEMTSSCTVVVAAPAPAGAPGAVQVRARMGGLLKANKLFTLEAAPATTAPPIAAPTTHVAIQAPPNSSASQSGTTSIGASTTTSASSTTVLTTDDSTDSGDEVAVQGPSDELPSADSGDDSANGNRSGSGGTRTKGVSTFVNATPGPQQSSLALAVVATNVLLTMLLLLIFGGTSAVFNSTLDANREVIESWLSRARARMHGFAGWFRLGSTMSPTVRVLAIVALSGTVYGFLSPGFTFDRAGLFLFLSLSVGITVVTYVSEGGAIWFSRRHLKTPAAIRVHTGALVTALACVIISRLLDFQPGLLYGFVASTAFLGATLDRRQTGRAAFYPALMLLGTSVAAWLVLGWVRSAHSDSWVIQLLEAILAVLFVGGIEGVLYNMLPIAFLDGRAIIEWNRIAWLGLFGVSTFLFWQLLINPTDSYIDAIRETGVALVLSAAAIYALITAATWLYFRRLAAAQSGRGAA